MSGKGTRYQPEHSTYRDRATGATIHQLTSHASINHPTYFLQSSFTPDGETLIFISYRTGSAQLFEIATYPHGQIRQLTEGPAIHPFSPAIHPDGRHVFFVRGGSIWEIRRETLEERSIIEVAGAQLGECSLGDRKSTRLNSSHSQISYAVFCLKKKKKKREITRMRSATHTIGV